MMKKKILIIDDEKSFTEAVKLSLNNTGEYEVIAENDGRRGLAAAKSLEPDLIFLDIMMPNTDGGTIANQIRSNEGTKDTPIVFITAAVTKEEALSQANIISGYPFIAKPASMEDLIKCIKENVK